VRHLERFGIIETTKVISALDFLGPSDLGSRAAACLLGVAVGLGA
jgi:hypothetical protein